jgi:hypothetical protein
MSFNLGVGTNGTVRSAGRSSYTGCCGYIRRKVGYRRSGCYQRAWGEECRTIHRAAFELRAPPDRRRARKREKKKFSATALTKPKRNSSMAEMQLHTVICAFCDTDSSKGIYSSSVAITPRYKRGLAFRGERNAPIVAHLASDEPMERLWCQTLHR